MFSREGILPSASLLGECDLHPVAVLLQIKLGKRGRDLQAREDISDTNFATNDPKEKLWLHGEVHLVANSHVFVHEEELVALVDTNVELSATPRFWLYVLNDSIIIRSYPSPRPLPRTFSLVQA